MHPAVDTRTPKPLRREDLTIHEIDGDALVYDASSADTHRLNRTALFIWHRCDGDHDRSTIARALSEVYDVSEATALEHVDRMIITFQQRRLLNLPE